MDWIVLTKQQAKAKQLKEDARVQQKAANQVNAMLRHQLDEAMNHLARNIELLVMWETSMETNQPPFDGEEADLHREVEKRMKGIKRGAQLYCV